MGAVQIAENIYWVGALDWNIRYFHGPTYETNRGTTYNAYLIIDEKVTLVDTVYGPFAEEMLANIREVIDPARIDVIVSNHLETDHSGAMPEIMKYVPDAPVYISGKGAEGMRKHYDADNWDLRVVKTGDQVDIGQRTLTFIEAPMLHWPDSMFTYINEDEILMPNDAFGQHLCTSKRFDDELDMAVIMEEAAKYYANILYPFSRLVDKKLADIEKMGLNCRMIAPSHGIIWRSHPEKIVQAYKEWATGKAREKAVVVYDTMWDSTEKMARAIVEGLIEEDVEAYLFKAEKTDRTDIIAHVLDARAVLVGSSTINNDMLPTVVPIVEELKGLKPVGKIGAAFGSYGWAGGAVKHIAQSLDAAGMQMVDSDSLEIKWVPTEEELARCREFGRQIGRAIKEEA